jgi:Kef-type K+ transport system membrane component KefB
MLQLIPSVLTLIIVIMVARFFGMLCRKIRQPSVMGEVLGGIILGPSVVGAFFPQFTEKIFHPDALTFLKHTAEIGIIFYLFVIGLEVNLSRLAKSARAAVIVSQTSIFLPFLLGISLAYYLHDIYAPTNVGFLEFSLFVGVSLSITAFPVLARILEDSSLRGTRLGDLALTCAAIDDVTAWCLVAVIIGIMNSTGGYWLPIVLTSIYVLTMLLVVRPMVEKFLTKIERRVEHLPQALIAFAVLGALISAALTEFIGIHAFFGAFLFGAIIPHNSSLAREISGRLQDFVAIIFLPAFFALTGVKTQIGLIANTQDILICAGIIAVAVLGKFGGAFAGGLISGQTKRESAILGVLMNTRGLVELIVLNIGLSLGILTPTLFTMFVIMAIVTTFMAGPLLKLVSQKQLL